MLLFKDGLLLKLCDFGTAKKLEHTLTNAVGTIRYMAPEVITGTAHATVYTIISTNGTNEYNSVAYYGLT